jgi:serine O-acetyltransferase
MNSRLVQVSISQLAAQILESYQQVGGINHLDGVNLPSKSGVAQIAMDLLRLVFPGFFSEKPTTSTLLKHETVLLLDAIGARLEAEMLKSLAYAPALREKPARLESLARQLTMEFLGQIPNVRQLLQTDAEAAYNGDPAALSKEEVIVAYPFMEAIAIQRMAHELYRRQIPLIPRMMTEWAHSRTGIDLHPGAQIGSHFFIDHGTGTVVGETVIIGNHVKMYHGDTLGAKSTSAVEELRGKKRHPTIEDRVTIYPSATILGGDTVIGAGSTIGGNVFLTTSVPPNSLVTFEGFKTKVMTKNAKKAIDLDYEI